MPVYILFLILSLWLLLTILFQATYQRYGRIFYRYDFFYLIPNWRLFSGETEDIRIEYASSIGLESLEDPYTEWIEIDQNRFDFFKALFISSEMCALNAFCRMVENTRNRYYQQQCGRRTADSYCTLLRNLS